MGYTCERVGTFAALIAFCISASLATVALFTSHWFDSAILTKTGGIAAGAHVNAGLFWGERVLEYENGARKYNFSVVTEVRAGYSFMARPVWCFCVFFAALGLLWVGVGSFVALFAAISRKRQSVAGPIGIYLWSLLALISFSACVLIYYIQFMATIKNNVLLQTHLDAGLSTQDQARLGTSFYMMLAALAALYFPPTFIFFSHQQQRKARQNAKISNL
ncbi:unnamed protein product, partial [Mesorhabditis belari]|uniref:Uncharacterized protein n=1 Tax=Mesorhabditis belari TaxID=2138241 RepID=A0AAF3EIA0_9BILA